MPTNKRKSSAARPAREHEVPQPNSDSVVPSSSIQKQVITSPFVVTLSRQAGNDAHATAAARTIWYVRPDSIWASLAKYRNFTMKDHTYSVHQYAVISRPQPLPEPLHPIDDDNIQCIARILEIRALNPANVYVRVYWLYRPDELRGGRQNYHGTQELIATNHMEIVDALRVLSPIDVVHWKEEQSSGIPQGDLYWRQFYDVTTQMASVNPPCSSELSKCTSELNPGI
ncbi:MAG: hypothetical protein LQ346_001020 [Caloplaca aetnensis]|nr:MAG: hypothetical protein LQ346_001020 [Caloplaca aetnensis]